MKKTMVLAGIVLVLGIAFVGCPSNNDPPPPPLTGTVTVFGNPWAGHTLWANTEDLGGSGTISFQWMRRSSSGASWSNISGATVSNYRVQSGDLNWQIAVSVTRAGHSGSVVSVARTITNAPVLTGTVSITGNPWVGQTLTADTENLGGSGGISFQWQRDYGSGWWNNISGATSSTYIVQSSDLNRNIRVNVTRSNNSGSVVSNVILVTNEPVLTGTVSVTGNTWIGQTLTANTASLGGNGDISFQWQRDYGWGWWDNISGATGSTYVVQSVDLDRNIRVNVTRANISGSVTSGAVGPITSGPPLTGTVSVTGNAWVGHTLTANTENLGGSGDISFQWQHTNVGGSIWTNINGATDSTYVVQSGDLNRNVRVNVTRTGHSGSVVSAARNITNAPALTGTVNVTGNAWVGHTLTANTASLGGSGDISYQWVRRNDSWSNWSNISGATGNTFVVRSADLNWQVAVIVTRFNNSGSVTSAARTITTAPALTGTVSITGAAQVGRTLTANTASLGGSGAISFQWQRTNVGGSTWSNISGATGSTYVVQSGDLGRNIRVSVTRFNNSGSVNSPQTTAVVASDGGFTISFGAGIEQITGPTVSLATGPETITVSNPEQFSQIRWFRGGTLLSGSGSRNETLTLNASVHNNRIGIHRVTVEVIRNGVLHSMVVEFTVVP
ncbi:MAG: hypothetical protein FWB78_01750 [Treponema sp.]|nr:hypothetical protein [Treponema sp.]